MAMLRSVVGNEQASDLVRDKLSAEVFGPIARCSASLTPNCAPT